MVSVVKVYKCDDVRVECGDTNLFTISDNSGDTLVLYRRDLATLYAILGKMVEDGTIDGVKNAN